MQAKNKSCKENMSFPNDQACIATSKLCSYANKSSKICSVSSIQGHPKMLVVVNYCMYQPYRTSKSQLHLLDFYIWSFLEIRMALRKIHESHVGTPHLLH